MLKRLILAIKGKVYTKEQMIDFAERESEMACGFYWLVNEESLKEWEQNL